MNSILNIKSFLFENKTLKQTVVKNTFWISVSAGICKTLRAILIIYIARVLGPTNYGGFAFALAFVSLFVSFLDMGLSPIITREFSRDENRKKEFYALFSLKLFLGIATTILVLIGSLFITNDLLIRKTIWVLAIFSFIGQFPELFYAVFRSRERMEYESFANVFQVILLTIFVFFVAQKFLSIINIGFSYLFSSLFALILVFIFFNYKIFPLKLSIDFEIWKKFLKMSWPLALTSIFTMIYGYIDSTILGYSGQVMQTGLYNAASRITSIVVLPASIISMAFYPVLSRSVNDPKEKFQKIWDYQAVALFFLAFPLVLGGLALAPKIIETIYGASYLPAVPAFKVLMLMSGVAFFQTAFTLLLIACNLQKKTFLVAFLGAIANTIFNIFLIARFNFYGAAISSLLTYILMFIVCFVMIVNNKKITPFNYSKLPIFSAIIISALAMFFIISTPFIYNMSIFISVLVGFLAYILLFAFQFGIISVYIMKHGK